MPRQRRRQSPPLIYRPLSTRHSSYPAWVMIKTSPTPSAIKASVLGNDIAQALLSCGRALQVPPMANDIAAVLPWLLERAPSPLKLAYHSVAVNLYLVCDFHSIHHVPPNRAHLRISLVVTNVILYGCFHQQIYDVAKAFVTNYLSNRWGDRLTFAGMKFILLELYSLIFRRYYGSFNLEQYYVGDRDATI
jgi:hypothetical protein